MLPRWFELISHEKAHLQITLEYLFAHGVTV